MILVARPQQHLAATLNHLARQGFADVISFPLSQPRFLPLAVPHGATAIIFTSALGVHPGLPKLPSCCVGPKTARVAEMEKFPVTIIGTSNAVSMTESINAAKLPPQIFLHAHGDKADLTWHKSLQKSGHRVIPLLTYRTHLADHIPAAALKSLRENPPACTLLFSSESARHILKLLKREGIPLSPAAIAISEKVAHLAREHWSNVITAKSPTLEAMVDSLKKEQKHG